MDTIELGPVPALENCAQAGTANFEVVATRPRETGNDTNPTPGDWRAAYEPALAWAFRRPCGAWFRACSSVLSPRQRMLTMASCRHHLWRARATT